MAFYDEGIYDPLTGLLAPQYFYESSERLVSWAQRTERHTSLIAIRLENLSDDDLVKCATEINSELRGGDLLARMQEKVFVLHLLGDELGANQLVFRLRNKVKFDIEFQVTQITNDEKLTVALSRLGI